MGEVGRGQRIGVAEEGAGGGDAVAGDQPGRVGGEEVVGFAGVTAAQEYGVDAVLLRADVVQIGDGVNNEDGAGGSGVVGRCVGDDGGGDEVKGIRGDVDGEGGDVGDFGAGFDIDFGMVGAQGGEEGELAAVGVDGEAGGVGVD